ncbi:basic salivary proline-rich protein 2-like [Camarhynchus parvulus]|uniref:basic salivary proline-rich protein 2-like n=1 Tax=Geospiza parvula TaxID=87175 RepID=UPI001237C2D5|nr:basic salivary proline-rich protein 2-like [Camarhynchus parvulus]
MGPTLQRHPFSGLVDSAARTLTLHLPGPAGGGERGAGGAPGAARRDNAPGIPTSAARAGPHLHCAAGFRRRPLTRARARLLGPCFKTGRRRRGAAGPGPPPPRGPTPRCEGAAPLPPGERGEGATPPPRRRRRGGARRRSLPGPGIRRDLLPGALTPAAARGAATTRPPEAPQPTRSRSRRTRREEMRRPGPAAGPGGGPRAGPPPRPAPAGGFARGEGEAEARIRRTRAGRPQAGRVESSGGTARAPPVYLLTRVATSDLRSQAQSPKARPRHAAPRAPAGARAGTAASRVPPAPAGRGDGGQPPSRRREPKRQGPRAETAPRGRTPAGRRRATASAGRARGATARPRRPETATEEEEEEEEEEQGGPREEGVGTPRPRRSRPRARGSTARYPRGNPPADSRPRGGEAGGEARASPPSLASLSLSLARSPFPRPSAALSAPSLALPPAAAAASAAGPPARTSSGPSGSFRERGATERSPSLHLGGRRPFARRRRRRRRPPGRRQGIEGGRGKRFPRPTPPTAFPPRHRRAAAAAAAHRGQRACEATPAAPPGWPPDGD